MKEAAPFIAFGVAVVVIRIRNRGRPAPVGLAGLPARARITLVAGWLLGGVGIVGASVDEAFAVALIPGGLLLLACAWDIRDFRPPNMRPGWLFPVGMALIGLGWTGIGVAELVSLL
jgi:membrane protein CcdC involved in cytochrome C biogenesis